MKTRIEHNASFLRVMAEQAARGEESWDALEAMCVRLFEAERLEKVRADS